MRVFRFNDIQKIVGFLEVKNPVTYKHSVNVANLSKVFADALRLDKKQSKRLYNMCLLHDIGKLAISDNILDKKGTLEVEEFNQVKNHVKIGRTIIEMMGFGSDFEDVAYYHHERWDGKGYLKKLKGEEIPVNARIVSILDAYEALTSGRPYKDPVDSETALEIIREAKGQFDPSLTGLFIDCISGDSYRKISTFGR